jgi:hypothetical protein
VKAVSRARLRLLSFILIAVSLLFTAQSSQAQLDLSGIGPSKGQVIGAAVGAIAVVTIVGVVIYFAVRQPRVTGCVAAGPDGSMTLQGSGSSDPLYLLQNAPPTLQTGQRVKVFGKKTKDANKARVFTIARVDKVYGACTPTAVPAHAMLDAPPEVLAVAAP